MGKALSKIFGNKEMRVLMLGLDNAGRWCWNAVFSFCSAPLVAVARFIDASARATP
jgi:hypothetical protein